MAIRQVVPTTNSKLGTNSMTKAGSADLSVVRSGAGTVASPYVDTVDLSKTTKSTIKNNISSLRNVENALQRLQAKVDALSKSSDIVSAPEYLLFQASILTETSGQTISITKIHCQSKNKQPTGFYSPTITSANSAGENYNNRFSVTKFMGTSHANYMVQANIENATETTNNVITHSQLGVEILDLVSGEFTLIIVNK